MNKFNKEQKIIALQYINKLLKKYNIKAKITKHGWAGRAFPYSKNERPKIRIPNPTNLLKLGTAIHEIGHIILGHCKYKNNNNKYIDNRPNYMQEYEAEQFSINKLKKLGFYTKDYETEAIRYVLENIAQAYNKKHPLNKIPKKIIKWTGLKKNTWKKYEKVFVPREQNDFKSKKDIIIQFKLPNKSIYKNKFNK